VPKMIRMISKNQHVYAGRILQPGDEFDVEPQHVHLMTVLGRAERKPDPVPQEEPTYGTRAMTARRTRRGKTLQ